MGTIIDALGAGSAQCDSQVIVRNQLRATVFRELSEKERAMIEAKVRGVARTADPFLAGVVLERLDNREVLPIFVGMLEAESCFLVLANIARPRPQSHDLAKNLLDVLGAKIDKVIVTDLQEDCYYAVIHLLDKGGVQYDIDARPSDAIALALRSDCPIFVEERVFIKYAQQREEEKQNRGTSLERHGTIRQCVATTSGAMLARGSSHRCSWPSRGHK